MQLVNSLGYNLTWAIMGLITLLALGLLLYVKRRANTLKI